MNPIYSMTGFASVRGATEGGLEFSLTAKSVNHRFLDLQLRFPGGLDALEVELRQAFKARLRRGHVDLTLALEHSGERRSGAGHSGEGRSGEGELRINDDLLNSALAAFRTAAARHHLSNEPDLNVLLRLPGVMAMQRANPSATSADLEASVAKHARDLIEDLLRVRAQEGAALAAELRASMERLRERSIEIGQLRASVRDAHLDRLRSRLAELLGASGVSEDRLLTEAALLVERSDIEEENVRLLTHVERFLAIIEAGGEVGKRLDFLLQELNREANTMLSKTGGAAGEIGLRITEIGLEMKTEIERAREQVQNLE